MKSYWKPDTWWQNLARTKRLVSFETNKERITEKVRHTSYTLLQKQSKEYLRIIWDELENKFKRLKWDNIKQTINNILNHKDFKKLKDRIPFDEINNPCTWSDRDFLNSLGDVLIVIYGEPCTLVNTGNYIQIILDVAKITWISGWEFKRYVHCHELED